MAQEVLNKVITILLELVRDVKSRKFLVAVGAVAIIVVNAIQKLGLSIQEQLMIVGLAGGYMLVEGIADWIERYKTSAPVVPEVTQTTNTPTEVEPTETAPSALESVVTK